MKRNAITKTWTTCRTLCWQTKSIGSYVPHYILIRESTRKRLQTINANLSRYSCWSTTKKPCRIYHTFYKALTNGSSDTSIELGRDWYNVPIRWWTLTLIVASGSILRSSGKHPAFSYRTLFVWNSYYPVATLGRKSTNKSYPVRGIVCVISFDPNIHSTF